MLTVDLDDALPLYLQIARGIRAAIARGEVAVGQQLPSVRQLAGDLALNLNTVARAYRQLEEDGLLRIRQGRGARVVSDQIHGDTAGAAAALERSLAQAFTEARLAGLDRAAMEQAIRTALDGLGKDKERK